MRGSRKFCQGDPTLFSIRGKRIQIALKAGHQRPPAKRHFNGVSLAGRRWPNIECWLGSFFLLFRGSDKGKEDPNSTKSGPSAAASETPF